MTAPRLIRLVPTGEVFQGVEMVEPCDVQPLSLEEIGLLTTDPRWSHLETPALALFARAIEQAHGIGRRLDA